MGLSFGPWLKQRRRRLDLTQGEMARQAACSVVTIRKIESSDLLPSTDLAQLLAATLEVPEAQWRSALPAQASDAALSRGAVLAKARPQRIMHELLEWRLQPVGR